MLRTTTTLALLVLLAATSAARSSDGDATARVAFRADTWELSGDATIDSTGDQPALAMRTGKAIYRGVEFQDGTIEFDLEVTSHRSFVFVEFRETAPGEHEEIYFRPHKSRLPDAIQYTPTYSGRSQWQLFHDACCTAPARFPPGETVHVKIELAGRTGAVTVGAPGEPEPQLRFTLARPAAAGSIALRSFLPPLGTKDVPADAAIARFSNLSIRPGSPELPDPETTEPPPGLVSHWLLSPAFVPGAGAVEELPEEILAATNWKSVPLAAGKTFVAIEPHITRPESARRAAVLARLEIGTDHATTRRLDLGFSDEISVFLNGRLVASADDHYSFNNPRRQGLIGLEQLAVYLPLEAGRNDLTLAVTDRFGGWGLAGRFEDPSGLTIEPR